VVLETDGETILIAALALPPDNLKVNFKTNTIRGVSTIVTLIEFKRALIELRKQPVILVRGGEINL
jgi:hypothetical protein